MRLFATRVEFEDLQLVVKKLPTSKVTHAIQEKFGLYTLISETESFKDRVKIQIAEID